MSAVPESDQPVLLREDREGICTLTFNRPQQMNLLTGEMLSALQREFESLKADQKTRVVILAATGKGFSAGHDLKEIRALKELPKIEALFGQCSRMMQTIPLLPQPVIAKVQGVAAAAGCQLVAQCDLAVASSHARFAASGVNLGLFCSTPAVAISRNLGRKRAAEMLFTGEFVDADTALDWGLVNRVAPHDQAMEIAQELARNLKAKPREVLALGKALFYRQLEQDMAAAYADASRTIAANMDTDLAREGVDAFFDKRSPRWGD